MPTLRKRKAAPPNLENSSTSAVPRDARTKLARPKDSNVDDSNEERPPKKKRKAAKKNKVANETSVENSLGGLPVEIWVFEICADLEPKDLWHLSCTSKHFRHILKNSDLAPTLWKASRALIGMPDCPPDLTDIQYTNLAFGAICQYCRKLVGKDYRPPRTLFTSRIRACLPCIKARFVVVQGQPLMDAQVQEACPKKLVPYLPKALLPYRQCSYKMYYSIATGEDWKRECSLSGHQVKWLKAKLKELNEIEAHGAVYKEWDEIERKNDLFRRRQTRFIAHIKSLGWSSELAQMSRETYQSFLKSPRIIDACQNEMTDTVLNSMVPFINTSMSQYRALRLCAIRKALLVNRLPILSEVAKECAARYSLYTPTPSAAELFNIQLVRDAIDDTSLEPFSSAHLDALRLNYAEISQEWRAHTEERLVGLIKSACGTDYNFDEGNVLRLATTIFSCTKCRDDETVAKDNLWYPNVLAHYHPLPYDIHRRADRDLLVLERRSLELHTGSTFWNDDNDISFNKEHMQAMSNILKLFGFDPAVTTSEEMDAADPIFECVSCNCLHKGRYVLRWNMLARHHYEHERDLMAGVKVDKYERLSGDDEVVAKRCIDDDNGRRHANTSSMVCVHCRRTGSSASLSEHAWKDHGISELSDSDILLSPTARTINHSRMWPPRKIKYVVSRT